MSTTNDELILFPLDDDVYYLYHELKARNAQLPPEKRLNIEELVSEGVKNTVFAIDSSLEQLEQTLRVDD